MPSKNQVVSAASAASRSRVYALLSAALAYPEVEVADQLASGRFSARLARAVLALPFPLGLDGLLDGGAGADPGQAYLAAFDVGSEAGPPCPPYGGEHLGYRLGIMADVLRYYRFFGLRLEQGRRERPDHLATELEFLHALTFKEAAELARGGSVGPLRQAQRDFLRFHLEEFTAAVAERLAGRRAPFYPALAALAAAFCRAERAYLG